MNMLFSNFSYEHFPVVYVKVSQSCQTLFYFMEYSSPGSSIHRILQARILNILLSAISILCFVFVFVLRFNELLFSHSVVSNSLLPHGLQLAMLPCPSLSPWVCSNSYTLSQWCRPTIFSVTPFCSCPWAFQHQGLFQWVNFTHQMAKMLELQLQFQFF